MKTMISHESGYISRWSKAKRRRRRNGRNEHTTVVHDPLIPASALLSTVAVFIDVPQICILLNSEVRLQGWYTTWEC